MRMAVLGWQWQDGDIIVVVPCWWCSIFFNVSFNVELMSFLKSPLSQLSISVADCYRMHLYHTLEMAMLGFLLCVASWLMFDSYNQQYTY